MPFAHIDMPMSESKCRLLIAFYTSAQMHFIVLYLKWIESYIHSIRLCVPDKVIRGGSITPVKTYKDMLEIGRGQVLRLVVLTWNIPGCLIFASIKVSRHTTHLIKESLQTSLSFPVNITICVDIASLF